MPKRSVPSPAWHGCRSKRTLNGTWKGGKARPESAWASSGPTSAGENAKKLTGRLRSDKRSQGDMPRACGRRAGGGPSRVHALRQYRRTGPRSLLRPCLPCSWGPLRPSAPTKRVGGQSAVWLEPPQKQQKPRLRARASLSSGCVMGPQVGKGCSCGNSLPSFHWKSQS